MKVVLFKRFGDGIWRMAKGTPNQEDVVTIGKDTSYHIKKTKEGETEKPELICLSGGLLGKDKLFPLYFVDGESSIPFEFEAPKEIDVKDPQDPKKVKMMKFKAPSPTHLHALLVRDTWKKVLRPSKADLTGMIITIGFGFFAGVVATIIMQGMG